MESAGHSRLLKYLLPSSPIHTSKMSEPHSYKVKFDYKNPENIDAEVPNEQKLRENDQIVIFEEDTFAPVMTVKKEEAALTKGDMKLQKISVTENISENKNGGMYIVINPMYSTITGEVITGPQPLRQIDGNIQVSTEVDGKPIEEKKSKTRIPKFKQTVEKLQKQKREDERREENEVPPSRISHMRRSSIPRLKGRKTASTVTDNTNDEKANNVETDMIINNENTNNTGTNIETKPEDEFDKIYEQIVDDQQTEVNNDMLIDSIEDPDELETSFEEIIHSYEENPVVKSKIPLLKQKSLHDIKLPKKYDRRYSLKNGAIVGDNTVDNPLKVKENLRPIESNVDVSKDVEDDTNSESKKVVRNNEIIDENELSNKIKETDNSFKNAAVVGDNTLDNPLKVKENVTPIESNADVSKDIEDDTYSESKKVIRINESIDEKEISNNIKETVNSLKNAAVAGDNMVDNPLKDKEDLRPIESTVDVSKDIECDINSESKKVIRNNEIFDEKELNNKIKETDNSLKNAAVAGDNMDDNPLKVKEDLRPIESNVDVSKDIEGDTNSGSKKVVRENEIIYEKSTNNDVKESVKVATPIFEHIKNNDNRGKQFIKPESVYSDNNFEIPDSSKMVINIQAVTRTNNNPIDEIKKDTPEENESYEIRKELAVLRERLSKRIKKFDSMEPISDAQRVSIPKRSASHVDQTDFKEPKDVPTEKVKTEVDTKYNEIDSYINVQNNIEKIKHSKIEQSIDIENITEKGPIIKIKETQTKYVPVHIKHKSTKIPEKTNKILTSDDVNNLRKGVDEVRNNHSPILRGNVSKIINRLVSNDGVEVNKEKNDYVEPITVKKSVSSRIAMFERQESETTSRPFIETKIPKPKLRANTQKPKIVDELLKSQGNVDSEVNVTKEEIPIQLDPVLDDNLKAINNIEIELNNLKEDVFVTKEGIEVSCEIYENEENNNEYIQIITENNEESEFKMANDAIKSNLINNNNDFKPTNTEVQKNLQSNNEIQTQKHETIKNEFKPKDNKAQNEFNTIDSSKENDAFTKIPMLTIEDRLKRMTSRKEEEMKRSKSVAELDIGDTIKGKVHRMIVRINSIEKIESEKKEINVKERPRKRSVSEKIALFEIVNDRGRRTNVKEIDSKSYIQRKMGFPLTGSQYPWIVKMLEYLKDEEGEKWQKKKLTPVRMEETTTTEKTTKVETKKPVEPTVSDEVFNEKIAELTNAKTKYGRMDDMIYLKLRNGAEMPVLAIGTALVHPRLLHHVVGAAIDLGYRAFDTAYIYGNEKEVGQAIKAKIDDGTVQREDLFISSKLWSTFHRQDLVETACRSSLEAMGLEYFDLFMIHNPMSFLEGADPIPTIANVIQFSTSDYLDAWFGMEELVTKGLARSIGVSNFNSEQIARVTEKARVKPVINQVECHPYLTQERLDQFCGDRDIKLNCFGVLGSKGTPDEYKSNLLPVIEDPLIKCMAAGLKITPAQLLLRYQIERGHSAVVKSSSASHLWENLQSLTITLSQIQVDALTALNRNKRTFAFKGMGDTHKNYPFKIPF